MKKVLAEVEVGYSRRYNRFDIITGIISGYPVACNPDKTWTETWEVNGKSIEADTQKIVDNWNQDLIPGELPRKIIRIVLIHERNPNRIRSYKRRYW
jgi:hypothetical protein